MDRELFRGEGFRLVEAAETVAVAFKFGADCIRAEIANLVRFVRKNLPSLYRFCQCNVTVMGLGAGARVLEDFRNRAAVVVVIC